MDYARHTQPGDYGRTSRTHPRPRIAHDLKNAAMVSPDFTRKLLAKARLISPICHERISRRFLHIGGARGATNDQPDESWKSLIESLERLAHQHATDPELGPLYSAMVKHERSWLESMKMRSINEDDE